MFKHQVKLTELNAVNKKEKKKYFYKIKIHV